MDVDLTTNKSTVKNDCNGKAKTNQTTASQRKRTFTKVCKYYIFLFTLYQKLTFTVLIKIQKI